MALWLNTGKLFLSATPAFSVCLTGQFGPHRIRSWCVLPQETAHLEMVHPSESENLRQSRPFARETRRHAPPTRACGHAVAYSGKDFEGDSASHELKWTNKGLTAVILDSPGLVRR